MQSVHKDVNYYKMALISILHNVYMVFAIYNIGVITVIIESVMLTVTIKLYSSILFLLEQ